MRIRLHLLVLLGLLLPAAAFAQGSRATARSFAEVAVEAFDEWDGDDDGTLSAAEIDQLVVAPKFKGEYAAALAAMKLVVRSTKVAPPVLSLDFLRHRSKEPAGELLPGDQPSAPEPASPGAKKPESPDITRPAPRAARPPASLERRYQSALRKIRSAKDDLFADGTPDIDRSRQGPLGSCFFIAGVGAFVHRDPEALKAMFRTAASESGGVLYTVTFGDGRAVTIPALTDAQRGLTSSAGPDGLWLTVLEQAYGALRMQSRPESRRTLEASDALARGGSLGTTLRALTGRVIERTRLRANADTDPELAGKVAVSLAAAMKDRRLAGASTGSATPLPPGVNGKHAYAILGFDESTGVVRLWNPHGNTFRPKGEAGLERGYGTRGGVFEVPVTEFVRIFDSLVIESDRPADAPAGRG